MSQTGKLAFDIFKALLFSLLAFFLIPAITYVFVDYAQHRRDAQYAQIVEENLQAAMGLTDEQKAQYERFVQAYPPSIVCSNGAPELQPYRSKVCAPYSYTWQFYMAGLVSWWTLVGGLCLFAAIFALGALAFASRSARYLSFVVGWRVLSLASAVEVMVQGSLAVWLSFWLPAFFLKLYSVRVVLFVGIMAALAAFYALAWIFKRQRKRNALEGALLRPNEEPALWGRVRDLAHRVGTAPPDHIIAGIDTNFFVTEAPLSLNGQEIRGRSLFISLPLLRVLDATEADAILAHELAHFRGGDAASGAKLGPQLMQFDFYCSVMRVKGVVLAFFILLFYRLIFELAVRHDSRRREFMADGVAAQVVSGQAVVHALIKVAAYAGYRKHIERWLFEQRQRHAEALGIGGKVAAGLSPYAASAQFIDEMRLVAIPHPFDPHPRLPDRMRNVGYEVAESGYAAIATLAPSLSWADGIRNAIAIEARLWANYEQQFASEHEKSLAYRYLPANAEEEAIVLKYFPTVVFQLKRGTALEVSYAGVSILKDADMNAGKRLSWDTIVTLRYQNSALLGDRLIIGHPKRGLSLNRTTVRLAGIGKEAKRLKSVLALYWQRHKVMRQVLAR
jgi:Zn-dependent protease with chaperone function